MPNTDINDSLQPVLVDLREYVYRDQSLTPCQLSATAEFHLMGISKSS